MREFNFPNEFVYKARLVFDNNVRRLFLVNTREGPCVRLWVPGEGWFFAGPLEAGKEVEAVKPASPTAIESIVMPL